MLTNSLTSFLGFGFEHLSKLLQIWDFDKGFKIVNSLQDPASKLVSHKSFYLRQSMTHETRPKRGTSDKHQKTKPRT